MAPLPGFMEENSIEKKLAQATQQNRAVLGGVWCKLCKCITQESSLELTGLRH